MSCLEAIAGGEPVGLDFVYGESRSGRSLPSTASSG